MRDWDGVGAAVDQNHECSGSGGTRLILNRLRRKVVTLQGHPTATRQDRVFAADADVGSSRCEAGIQQQSGELH